MSFTLYDGGMQMKNLSVIGPTPGAPIINSVVQTAIGQVTINYTAPAYSGSSPITKFTVILLPDNTVTTVNTNTSGSVVFDGLATFQTYSFKVFATNNYGDGPVANSSSITVYPGTPDAPTITSVSQSGLGATISFTAPTRVGLSGITSYTAVSNPGNFTGTVNISGSGSVRVSGLSLGTSYSFIVYATNSYGNSPNSTSSSSVTITSIQGQIAYTTPGNYVWTVPEGVSVISAVAIGGGGGGSTSGGGGGALQHVSNFAVTSGQQISLTVGAGGAASNQAGGARGVDGQASVITALSLNAGGGAGGYQTVSTTYRPGGGGGAGGYTGAGTNGATPVSGGTSYFQGGAGGTLGSTPVGGSAVYGGGAGGAGGGGAGATTFATVNYNFNPGTVVPLGGSLLIGASGSAQSVSLSTGVVTGTGDFTWECWAMRNSVNSFNCLGCFSGSGDAIFRLNSSGSLNWSFGSYTYTAGANTDGSIFAAAGTWFHVAVVRSAGTVSLYINGQRITTAANATTKTLNTIGTYNAGANQEWNGYISNFRVSNNARYSGTSFTVPTTPFTTVDASYLFLGFVYNNLTDLTGKQTINLSATPPSVVNVTPPSLNYPAPTTTTGAGAGGGAAAQGGGSGGGVGIYGKGLNGASPAPGPFGSSVPQNNVGWAIAGGETSGGGGSSGTAGTITTGGGLYGGGGGGGSSLRKGGDGAIRIIWPGDTRQFPSTGTTDVVNNTYP